jgi:hypothetical protein
MAVAVALCPTSVAVYSSIQHCIKLLTFYMSSIEDTAFLHTEQGSYL